MGEGTEYAISLEDRMSGPAMAAAKSLGELAKSAHESKGGLSELTEGFIKTVEPAEVLRGAFEGVSEGFKSFAAGLKSGEAKEMIGGIFEAAAGLAQVLDLVIPGLGQVASAAIKVGGAFASMTVGLVQSGAELAIEANQDRMALIDMFSALEGGPEAGAKTEEMLTDLSHTIGITKKELAPFAASFAAMGIHGTEALEKVTLAAISAKAIMHAAGKDGGAAFESLTRKIQVAAQTGHGLKIPAKGLGSLAEMGVEVDDVAKRMGVSSKALADQLKAGTVDAKKFGDALQDTLIEKGAGPLARMSSSLENLKKMFGQSLDEMFEGVDIKPFLEGLKDLARLFDKDSVSGKILKNAVGGAFSYIFQQATKALPYIQIGILKLMTYSVRAHTFMKAHWSAISAAISTVGVALGILGGIAVAAIAIVTAPVWLAVGAFAALAAGIGWVLENGEQLMDDAVKWGAGIVDGLVNGITGGIEKAKAAAMDLGKGVKDSITGFLGISSPSLVFAQLGQHTAGGFAQGIEGGMGEAKKASASLAGASVAGVSAGPAPAAQVVAPEIAPPSRKEPEGGDKGAGKAMTIEVGGITITAPQGVTAAVELTEIAIATIFERLALSQGV